MTSSSRQPAASSRQPSTSVTLSEEELTRWGESIGARAEPPLLIALRGDLGAGKSTLARAVARGAGIQGPVPSPTFNLLFRYDAPRGVRIAHLDLYRIGGADEVWELGWSELPAPDEIVMIEWPERAESLLPVPRWEVSLEEGADAERRVVTVAPVGEPGPIPMPGEAPWV